MAPESGYALLTDEAARFEDRRIQAGFPLGSGQLVAEDDALAPVSTRRLEHQLVLVPERAFMRVMAQPEGSGDVLSDDLLLRRRPPRRMAIRRQELEVGFVVEERAGRRRDEVDQPSAVRRHELFDQRKRDVVSKFVPREHAVDGVDGHVIEVHPVIGDAQRVDHAAGHGKASAVGHLNE